jgi:alkyldihydroxyacetonephosphate synthase
MPSLLATPARPLEEIAIADSRLNPAERQAFAAILGADRVRDDNYERAFHARGRSYYDLLRLRAGDLSVAPDAVLYPRGEAEVLSAAVFRERERHRVVPYGGGTSVVGGVSAANGPFRAVVTLDLSGMDRVGEIDTVAETATAEAGIYGAALEKALQAKGVTLGHLSAILRVLDARRLDRASRRRPAIASLRQGRRLAARGARRDAERGSVHECVSGVGRGPAPYRSDRRLGRRVRHRHRSDRARAQMPEQSDYRGFLFRDFASGIAALREAAQEKFPSRCCGSPTRGNTGSIAPSAMRRKTEKPFGPPCRRLSRCARKFDSRACALIAGFEGAPAKSRRRAAASAQSPRNSARCRSATVPDSAGMKAASTVPYLRDPLMDRGVGVDTLETATSWSKLDALYAAVRTALESAIRETAPMPGRARHRHVPCQPCLSERREPLFHLYLPPRARPRNRAMAGDQESGVDAIAANGGTISHHHGVGEDHLPWMARERRARHRGAARDQADARSQRHPQSRQAHPFMSAPLSAAAAPSPPRAPGQHGLQIDEIVHEVGIIRDRDGDAGPPSASRHIRTPSSCSGSKPATMI